MQGDGDILPGTYPHIPDDEGIYPGFLLGEHLAVHFFHLGIAQQNVHGYEYPRPELVRIGAEPGNLLDGIAGILPGPELRTGDIYGIGTTVDRSDADVSIPCRR